jgi:hypothetical protein
MRQRYHLKKSSDLVMGRLRGACWRETKEIVHEYEYVYYLN